MSYEEAKSMKMIHLLLFAGIPLIFQATGFAQTDIEFI